MSWIKYGKTKNVTDCKNLNSWLNKIPEIENDRFVVTEKIDGSNFQIILEKGNDPQFGSRNRLLKLSDECFDFQRAVIRNCSVQIQLLQTLVDNSPYFDTINLYGELYGSGIHRRISYSDSKHFLPFYMKVDGKGLDFKSSQLLLKNAGIEDWWVPIINDNITLDEALNIDVESISTGVKQVADGNRLIEGIVIEPYRSVYEIGIDGDKSRFILKKKSAGFCDKSGHKHKERKSHKLSDEGIPLMETWTSMFNYNRLCDIESKEGPIEEMNQMGHYIKLMINDVREDFLLENRDEFIGLLQSDRSLIMGSGGRLAAQVLKDKLNK